MYFVLNSDITYKKPRRAKKKKKLKQESEETTTHEKKKKTAHDLHSHKEVQTRRGMETEETVDNVGKGIVDS